MIDDLINRIAGATLQSETKNDEDRIVPFAVSIDDIVSVAAVALVSIVNIAILA